MSNDYPSPMPMPLYDELREKALREQPRIDMVLVSRKIVSLAAHGREKFSVHGNIILALIYHHALLTKSPVTESLPPLGGNLFAGGRGVTYTINPNDQINNVSSIGNSSVIGGINSVRHMGSTKTKNEFSKLDPLIQAIISLYVDKITV